jgi:hypothetical protein
MRCIAPLHHGDFLLRQAVEIVDATVDPVVGGFELPLDGAQVKRRTLAIESSVMMPQLSRQ